MANLDFEGVLETLKNEVIDLAMSTVNNYKDEAKADALHMVNLLKDNLRTWTLELAEGSITNKDYEYLVMGQKELIEMNALKQAGIALIELDALKNSILSLIIKTVTGMI